VPLRGAPVNAYTANRAAALPLACVRKTSHESLAASAIDLPAAPAERRREGRSELVAFMPPVAALSPIAKQSAQFRGGPHLCPCTSMHDRVRTAKRRADTAREEDVLERARIAGSTYAARRPRHLCHEAQTCRGRAARANFSPEACVLRWAVARGQRERLAPLAAAALGVILVLGVVSWKLLASTYPEDVTTICNAEIASGFFLDREMGNVTEWVRGHLTTRQGGEFFASLRDEPLGDRARDLRAQAHALALGGCPLAQSYDELQAQAEYRADLQRLCSRFTFPGLGELAPAQRVQRLAEWIETEAITPRARLLAAPMGSARTVTDSGALLAQAAAEANLFTCDLAGTLEAAASLTCH
jgi:hypothetical protein